MVLSALSALSAFPNESILISVENTPLHIDGRLGINFIDGYYNYGNLKFKWNNYPLTYVDEETDLPAQLNPTFERVNMPNVFPIVYTVSGYTDYLHLDFQAGESTINVYPTRPYPIITYDSTTKVLYISAGLLPLTAFNSDVTVEEFRKKHVGVPLSPLPSSITFNGAYKSTSVFGKSVFSYNNPLFNTVATAMIPLTNKRKIKTGVPSANWSRYSEKIIPSSLNVQLSVAGTSFSATGDVEDYNTKYNTYWDRTVNPTDTYGSGTHKDLLLSTDIYYPRDDTGELEKLYITSNTDPTNGYINFKAFGTTYTDFLQQLYIEPKDTSPVSPKSAFYFPVNTDVNVWFETSAWHVNDVGAVSSTSFGSNYFAISARPNDVPIWGYGASFSYAGQNAFTVNFIPSAGIVASDLSSVSIAFRMVDNFYQTSLPIASPNYTVSSMFTITNMSDVSGLSAVNTTTNVACLENSNRMDSSATFKFINSLSGDKAAFYRLNLITSMDWQETAGIRQSYFQQPISFALNPDKSIITLNQSNKTNNSVDIQGLVSPDYDESQNVQWSVFPPENVVIINLEDNSIIPLNQNIPGGSLNVRIQNLGVDDTVITLYVPQYNRSGSTTWTAPTDIWANVDLRILGNVDDYDPVNTGTISAFFVRNNFKYRVPTNANILWDYTVSDPDATLSLYTTNNSDIIKNTTYPSTNIYSLIKGDFKSATTVSNPKNIDFRVNCSVFSPAYTYDARKTFLLREYPDNNSIFIDISSSQWPDIVSSEDYVSIVYTNSATVNLFADVDLLNISASAVSWSDGTSIFTGSSVSFNITAFDTCISISALDVFPSTGGFGKYNFYDTVCFYILSTIVPLDYISFPKNNYLPNVELNFGNYTSEYIVMSSYSACHTEYVYFSTYEGFDEYHWSVGDDKTITLTNTALVPVTPSSTISPINVSAFNTYFPSNNPSSVYNTVSSNGNIFKQSLTARSFPATTLTLSLDNNLVDMRQIGDQIVNFNASFSTIDLSASPFQLVLSSTQGVARQNISLFDNNVDFSDVFDYGAFDAFQIEENSLYSFNVFLEGTANKTINGFDFCSEAQTLTSNILTLTAFDGPDLNIWTATNVLSVNQNAVIKNTTFNTPLNPFTAFSFSDGNGNISTNLSFSDFSASYPIGNTTYNVSLSGYRSNGNVLTATWVNYFILEEGDEYDALVTRNTSSEITLPYNLDDITISPNSWQFSETLNDSFNRIKGNINYLNANCFLIDNNLPKFDISTYGQYKGVNTWRYDIDLSDLNQSISGVRYDDLILYKDYVILINNSVIEIRRNDNDLTLLNTITTITDVEQIKTPTRIQLLGDRLIILDEGANNVYVCTLDESDYSLTLTHYWGGTGAKNSRTKLNNPTDLVVINNAIYIADNDSDNVKVYNKFLNWTNNIQIVSPLALTGYNNVLFVLTSQGRVHKFVDLIEVDSFEVSTSGTNITYDIDQSKIYIIYNDRIEVFSPNGIFINNIQNIPNFGIRNATIQERELYVLSDNVIVKMYDPLYYTKITTLTDSENTSTSYRIHPNEPISSFVINDSISKLYEMLYTLNVSLTSQILKSYDNNDNFLYSTLSASTFESECDVPSLGINELVSYETVNREIWKLHDCVISTQNFINGKKYYPSLPPVWTWIYHRVNQNQRPNLNKTPLSWEELSSANPTYSSITWENVRFATGYENNFPLGWRWADLYSTCLNATTWDEMERGDPKDYTWQELESPIIQEQPFLFDSCK